MLVDAQALGSIQLVLGASFWDCTRLNSKGRASVLSKRHAYKQSLLAVAVGLNGKGTNMKHTT